MRLKNLVHLIKMSHDLYLTRFLQIQHRPLLNLKQSQYLYFLENKDIVIALNSIGADVGFVEIESDKGHDSFLLDVPDFLNALKNFLDKAYNES